LESLKGSRVSLLMIRGGLFRSEKCEVGPGDRWGTSLGGGEAMLRGCRLFLRTASCLRGREELRSARSAAGHSSDAQEKRTGGGRAGGRKHS